MFGLTLTKGESQLVAVVPATGHDEVRPWRRLRTRVGRGNRAGAEDRGVSLAEAADFRSGDRQGVRGTVDGKDVAIGNLKLVQDLGLKVEALTETANGRRDEGETASFSTMRPVAGWRASRARAKELIARAIHEERPGRAAAFVPVNCAVLGDELFESELFGHAKGAFTGAGQDRKGLLELSSGGTVLLDEVAELTPCAQAKLLRVLQDSENRRLGENRTQRLDLRVVAATNRPLAAEAAEGRFRRDLLYRLNVVRLTAPPLKGARAGRRPARRPLLEGYRRGGRQPRDPGAGDGDRACVAPVARQRPRAAERARQPPLSPGRATAPSARTLCRPPSGERSPPSGDRSPRPARTSSRRWCATPWGATAASTAPPASWVSPARASRS